MITFGQLEICKTEKEYRNHDEGAQGMIIDIPLLTQTHSYITVGAHPFNL